MSNLDPNSQPLPPIVGVGVMILDDLNRVLLGHRIKSGEVPTWCFPGGKIEAQESLEQSTVRELFEETQLNLNVLDLKPLLMMINRINPRVNITTGFVARLPCKALKHDIKVTEPHIFESWQWFDLDELPENLFPETAVMLQYWLKQKVDAHFSVYPLQMNK